MSSNPAGECWNDALSIIEKKMSKPSFEAWMKTLHPISFSDGVFTIGVPNEFARDWLEKRSSNIIGEAISSVLGQKATVCFKVTGSVPSPESEEDQTRKRPSGVGKRGPSANDPFITFNEKYTFDSFVVGGSNRFAQAAFMAVAKAPGTKYNPLFVHGGVGLGKTHLMHAIGNYISRERSDLRAAYVSAENFTNDVISAIRDDRTSDFRNKYRRIDIWLVDDIQFIAEKSRTQEEFFHTFNTLHDTNKQIVISSDCPPNELHLNDARLRSRMMGGLTVSIQPPDLETRIAILQKKAEERGVVVQEDVFNFIATSIHSNIRELEGAMKNLFGYQELTGQPATVDVCNVIFKEFLSEGKAKEITVQHIIDMVCDHFTVKPADLNSAKRARNIVLPRQIAMFLCRKLTASSLSDIGKSFGGKDHTTVMHACSQIHKKSLSNEETKELLRKLEMRLK